MSFNVKSSYSLPFVALTFSIYWKRFWILAPHKNLEGKICQKFFRENDPKKGELLLQRNGIFYIIDHFATKLHLSPFDLSVADSKREKTSHTILSWYLLFPFIIFFRQNWFLFIQKIISRMFDLALFQLRLEKLSLAHLQVSNLIDILTIWYPKKKRRSYITFCTKVL